MKEASLVRSRRAESNQIATAKPVVDKLTAVADSNYNGVLEDVGAICELPKHALEKSADTELRCTTGPVSENFTYRKPDHLLGHSWDPTFWST